ncbi:hypothetical protein Leryth_025200 [Lithospermum erythrorhizon]|nr:hypothetical protein Leryth_025200 [Lithospermum erythrorhizon]
MENKTKFNHGHKGLLQTQELSQYILESTVYPREPESLKELRAATASHPLAFMGTAPDAGQLMEFLLKQTNAKKTIEIGVFTGYSLLLTALSIPDNGTITAIDKDREAYKIGLPIIKKAGVEHKIDFIESEALPVLTELLQHDENVGSFDFAYVDADKVNYLNYHEKLLKLMRPGGTILYDNTLWLGTVAMPEDSVPERRKEGRHYTIEFNRVLAADTRVDISQVPLGDGIMVCRCI